MGIREDIKESDQRLINKLAEFFQQHDREQPGEGWICKANAMERVSEEMNFRIPKQQVIKSGVVCCGTCGHRVKDGYTYCNHCGQEQLPINKKEVVPNDSTDK